MQTTFSAVARDRLRQFGPALILIAVFAALATAAPGLLRWRAINGLLMDNAPLLLIIVGLTLPVLLGCLDLSVAAVASFSAVCGAILSHSLGSWAGPVVVAGAAVAGGVQGWLIGRLQIPSFVMTLGALGIFAGLALFISKANMVGIRPGLAFFDVLSARTGGMPNAFLIVLAIAAVLSAVLRFTPFGRDVYAFGQSELASYISGVRRDLVRTVAFAISSACAALGGMMMLSQTLFANATVANGLLLPALVGVVVGGTAISGGIGGVAASLIGGLIAVLIRVGATISGLPPASQDVAFGIVILIAVALTTDRSKMGIVK